MNRRSFFASFSALCAGLAWWKPKTPKLRLEDQFSVAFDWSKIPRIEPQNPWAENRCVFDNGWTAHYRTHPDVNLCQCGQARIQAPFVCHIETFVPSMPDLGA